MAYPHNQNLRHKHPFLSRPVASPLSLFPCVSFPLSACYLLTVQILVREANWSRSSKLIGWCWVRCPFVHQSPVANTVTS